MKQAEQGRLPASVSVKQMMEVDRLMTDEYGITLVQMMENAGRNLADLARSQLKNSLENKNITVIVGSGHNGGGGLVAARHLSNMGAEVTVILGTAERKLKRVPLLRWQTINKMSLKSIATPDSLTPAILKESHLIVDAILGYGLIGEPIGKAAEAIQMIVDSGNPRVLSLDIPSGLNGDTGEPAVPCVKAAATLTLALPKTGLLQASAEEYVGDLYVGDIGIPPLLYRKIDLEPQYLFCNAHILQIS